MIFVAVPLSGTGAWTSIIITSVQDLIKEGFHSIAPGVVEVAVIITVLVVIFNKIL
ncbi:MAG: hypothetical protein QG670_2727 [Thermoproteota archaeon]|nr:hypothetical protein [Thermoproteota archaeon]